MRSLIAFTLCLGVANAQATRNLLQGATGIALGDPDIDNTTTVYQKVTASTGDLQNIATANGWIPTSVVASLELSTNASYAYNYLEANGTTRFNATVRLSKTASSTMDSTTAPMFMARLQTIPCGSSNLDSNFLADSQGQTLPALTILPASNNFSQSMSGSYVTNSSILNMLVDYEKAQSIGIYGGSGMTLVACQNLRAPFPDFPNDWAATIEVTDAINGTTFVMRETYSQTLNKMRLDVHSYGNDHIILTNPASSSVTLIHASNGSCSNPRTTRRTNWVTGADNATLLSTADLLHFSNDSAFTYSAGPYDVRGIECEQWSQSVTLSNWANATFDVEFYFPVNQWQVAREDYHRMLKRVYMNGTWNNRPFETYTEYVNFRPITPAKSTFRVCAISPYGSNCNCTDALRRKAFKNVTSALSDSGSDTVDVAGADQVACNYGASMPHGFVSAQAGPYVGLTIIGMVAGALITGVVMFFVYRRRTGVTLSDNFGHQKFQDQPGT